MTTRRCRFTAETKKKVALEDYQRPHSALDYLTPMSTLSLRRLPSPSAKCSEPVSQYTNYTNCREHMICPVF